MNTDSPLVIIGAGAAGLTAAYEAVRRGLQPLVLEKADKVGALPRTETFKGYRFDIGGHRFFSKVKEVERLWQEKLGEEWLKVPRLSRIHYRGRFFDNPFAPLNALMNLVIFPCTSGYQDQRIHGIIPLWEGTYEEGKKEVRA